MVRKKVEEKGEKRVASKGGNKAKPGEPLCRNCNYGAAADPCANCGYKPKAK